MPNREEGWQISDGKWGDVVTTTVAEEFLARLSDRYRRFVVAYFFNGLRMHEIAFREGVNESRVSQIIGAALRLMRSDKRSRATVRRNTRLSHTHRMYKFGHDGRGRQRVRCAICNKTESRGQGSPTKRELKREEIRAALLVPGSTVRSVARKVNASTMTVATVAKFIELPKCPCGQEAGHRGWCRSRFEQSQSRQAVIAEWHSNLTESRVAV